MAASLFLSSSFVHQTNSFSTKLGNVILRVTCLKTPNCCKGGAFCCSSVCQALQNMNTSCQIPDSLLQLQAMQKKDESQSRYPSYEERGIVRHYRLPKTNRLNIKLKSNPNSSHTHCITRAYCQSWATLVKSMRSSTPPSFTHAHFDQA